MLEQPGKHQEMRDQEKRDEESRYVPRRQKKWHVFGLPKSVGKVYGTNNVE